MDTALEGVVGASGAGRGQRSATYHELTVAEWLLITRSRSHDVAQMPSCYERLPERMEARAAYGAGDAAAVRGKQACLRVPQVCR